MGCVSGSEVGSNPSAATRMISGGSGSIGVGGRSVIRLNSILYANSRQASGTRIRPAKKENPTSNQRRRPPEAHGLEDRSFTGLILPPADPGETSQRAHDGLHGAEVTHAGQYHQRVEHLVIAENAGHRVGPPQRIGQRAN